jgi:hypothetical protein
MNPLVMAGMKGIDILAKKDARDADNLAKLTNMGLSGYTKGAVAQAQGKNELGQDLVAGMTTFDEMQDREKQAKRQELFDQHYLEILKRMGGGATPAAEATPAAPATSPATGGLPMGRIFSDEGHYA